MKSNFIEDFIDAVSKAKESAIAKTLISNGYNFDEDYSDDRMVFAKEVNGYTVDKRLLRYEDCNLWYKLYSAGD